MGASAEQRMMEAIRRHFRRMGGAPSRSEISLACGIARNDVGRVLKRLETQGLLRLHPGVTRGIQLLDRAAMLSDSELMLASAARGWTIVKPKAAVAAIVDAYPLERGPDCSLPFDDLLGQIDTADREHGGHGEAEDISDRARWADGR